MKTAVVHGICAARQKAFPISGTLFYWMIREKNIPNNSRGAGRREYTGGDCGDRKAEKILR